MVTPTMEPFPPQRARVAGSDERTEPSALVVDLPADHVVLTVRGEIDCSTAAIGPRVLVLDLSAVTYSGSVGPAVLLEAADVLSRRSSAPHPLPGGRRRDRTGHPPHPDRRRAAGATSPSRGCTAPDRPDPRRCDAVPAPVHLRYDWRSAASLAVCSPSSSPLLSGQRGRRGRDPHRPEHAQVITRVWTAASAARPAPGTGVLHLGCCGRIRQGGTAASRSGQVRRRLRVRTGSPSPPRSAGAADGRRRSRACAGAGRGRRAGSWSPCGRRCPTRARGAGGG